MRRSRKSGEKIVVVANRLPVCVSKRKDELKIQQSQGGLAAALRSLKEKSDVTFIGWPGYCPADESERRVIEKTLIDQHQSHPVFIHIPFPSSEIFRQLPWRREFLEGVLGADLIGFHTYEYARHFLSSVLRLLGYEHEFGSIDIDNRVVKVENFPLGADFKHMVRLLEKPSVGKDIENFKRDFEADNRKFMTRFDHAV